MARNYFESEGHMKKILSVLWAVILCLGLFGCSKSNEFDSSEVFSFPEPIYHLAATIYECGDIQRVEIGTKDDSSESMTKTAPIVSWFYGLKLQTSEKPENVEGNTYYRFEINDQYVLGYDDRGGDDCYISIDGYWYRVSNPSHLSRNQGRLWIEL